MTQSFRVLYIDPAIAGNVDPSVVEQQSRAIRQAGGTLVRYEGDDGLWAERVDLPHRLADFVLYPVHHLCPKERRP